MGNVVSVERIEAPERAFTVYFDDGKVAHCEETATQPYLDCEFGAGRAFDVEPDTIYLRLSRTRLDRSGDPDEEHQFWFLRPDEAAALQWVLAGAMWSHVMGEDDEGNEDE